MKEIIRFVRSRKSYVWVFKKVIMLLRKDSLTFDKALYRLGYHLRRNPQKKSGGWRALRTGIKSPPPEDTASPSSQVSS